MQYHVWRAGGKSEYYSRGGTWYSFDRGIAMKFKLLHENNGILSYVKEYDITVNKPFIVPIDSEDIKEEDEPYVAYYYVYNDIKPDFSVSSVSFTPVANRDGMETAVIEYMDKMQGITGDYQDLLDILNAEGRWDGVYEFIEAYTSETLKKKGYDAVLFVDGYTKKPTNIFVFD